MLSQNPHDHQTNPGLVGEPVRDGDLVGLERLGKLILATEEKLSKAITNFFRGGDGIHSDLIPGGLLLVEAGSVLDEDDVEGAVGEDDLEDLVDVGLGTFLPLLGGELGQPGESGDHEMILEHDVFVHLCQLSILGSLALHNAVQATMVLFQGHHSVLQNPGALAVLGENLFRLQLRGLDQGDRGVEQMNDKLQPRIGSQVNTVRLKGGGSE